MTEDRAKRPLEGGRGHQNPARHATRPLVWAPPTIVATLLADRKSRPRLGRAHTGACTRSAMD